MSTTPSRKWLDLTILGTSQFRLIDSRDNELLRHWKNNFRGSFFTQKIITPLEQQWWFDVYEKDCNNSMLIWINEQEECGSLGVRNLKGVIDVYNVMSWGERTKGTGKFSEAVKKMLDRLNEKFAQVPIQTSVLIENPAIQWYQRLGFRRLETRSHESGAEFFLMEYSEVPNKSTFS